MRDVIGKAWRLARRAVQGWKGRGSIEPPENLPNVVPKSAVKPLLTVEECGKKLFDPKSSVKEVLQVIYELSNLVGENEEDQEEAKKLIFEYIENHKDRIQARKDGSKNINSEDSLVCKELAHFVGKTNDDRSEEMFEILEQHASEHVKNAVNQAKNYNKTYGSVGISYFSRNIDPCEDAKQILLASKKLSEIGPIVRKAPNSAATLAVQLAVVRFNVKTAIENAGGVLYFENLSDVSENLAGSIELGNILLDIKRAVNR
jgi:hypothetical protein